MDIALAPIDPHADRESLIAFLTSNRFPFHVRQRPTVADAEDHVARSAFGSPENVAFWMTTSPGDRVGYIAFEEVGDGTPMIDLRIGEVWRGQGIGTRALALGTAAVFTSHPEVSRIEGNTRIDNVAMRRVFVENGYVKEAHYRDGWPVQGSTPLDAVAYAILRRDWVSGSSTPVPWDT